MKEKDETKTVEASEEFLQAQYVADVELKHPIHYGKRMIPHLAITMRSYDSASIKDGVLTIHTDVDGRAEYFPESNVAKWRIDTYFVPLFPK